MAEALLARRQHGAPPPLERWTEHPATLVLDTTVPGRQAVPAAVLVALFEEDGAARVLLTRRSSALRHHRGQVSFPGGRLEEGEDVWSGACREAFEEVGLLPAAVQPVGWLHPVVTRVSGSLILPVVGSLAQRPALRANPHEVARVFDVTLTELADEGVFHEERWPAEGWLDAAPLEGSYPVYFFEVAGETVWGATARLLFELLSVVLIGRAP